MKTLRIVTNKGKKSQLPFSTSILNTFEESLQEYKPFGTTYEKSYL